MTEWSKLDWFAPGAVLGYFWHPLWQLGKKIVHEAKVTRNEWNKTNSNERNDQSGV